MMGDYTQVIFLGMRPSSMAEEDCNGILYNTIVYTSCQLLGSLEAMDFFLIANVYWDWLHIIDMLNCITFKKHIWQMPYFSTLSLLQITIRKKKVRLNCGSWVTSNLRHIFWKNISILEINSITVIMQINSYNVNTLAINKQILFCD